MGKGQDSGMEGKRAGKKQDTKGEADNMPSHTLWCLLICTSCLVIHTLLKGWSLHTRKANSDVSICSREFVAAF